MCTIGVPSTHSPNAKTVWKQRKVGGSGQDRTADLGVMNPSVVFFVLVSGARTNGPLDLVKRDYTAW